MGVRLALWVFKTREEIVYIMEHELQINREMILTNVRKEEVKLGDLSVRLVNYINQEPDKEYDIAIGTDSMTYDTTDFVLAVTIHRLHSGGIFFYKKMKHDRIKDLHQKLYAETGVSIDVASILIDDFKELGIDLAESNQIHFHIHMDIGDNGPTKELIQELAGWVNALGYDCEVKPDSYAASCIADKYSK